ncbi:MAG: dihydrolipoyl dehydrogenase [Proteobacteria bacterium]|nr:dihydrolipoyl dehydrogenase [Pseudomonadota bacterium]
MVDEVKLVVPDLGDFDKVEVIEILVSVGDEVAVEDSLITIETDKASMDIPAQASGTIVSVDVKVGDKVSTGDLVATVDSSEVTKIVAPVDIKLPGEATHAANLVVIGAGPGGYTAAFRAADLGVDVILVERSPVLGGVCLNVGCIPSKALLHAAKVIDDAQAMAEHGVQFGKPTIDGKKLGDWKNAVIARLTDGLLTMAKQRKVRVVHGVAKFESANRLRLDNDETIDFENCIIAAGSEAAMLPGLPDDPRIVDSTGALELAPLPKRMLVVGGGIIGLEMACVYSALGTDVSVVELTDSLMPGTDPDLLRPFVKVISKRYDAIMLATRVTGMRATVPGIEVSFEGDKAPSVGVYDRVLIAVGRRANGDALDAEVAGVRVDDRGIIEVDNQMRTNVPHIFAIGDLAGGPMLAHKATHEAKVAAEVVAGEKSYFDARGIPSVAYTDPEIAWVGLTELDAKAQGIAYEKAQFPWAASGRALSLGRPEGFTKLLFDKKTKRLLGGAIVGTNAGDLISEIVLALEMGADASDISLTIHPHPTLSETVAFAAEAYAGTLTDLYIPRKTNK